MKLLRQLEAAPGFVSLLDVQQNGTALLNRLTKKGDTDDAAE